MVLPRFHPPHWHSGPAPRAPIGSPALHADTLGPLHVPRLVLPPSTLTLWPALRAPIGSPAPRAPPQRLPYGSHV
jgi:hypothetical protein